MNPMPTIPATYHELAPLMAASDPEDLKRLLARRPSTLADLSWFPTHPQAQPVERWGIYRLIAAAVGHGVPAPQETCFISRAGIRQVELICDDDDRAAVTMYALMFACGLPRLGEATVLKTGLPGRFLTASHLLHDRAGDPDMPAGTDFGGWLVTVTCFVFDRPTAGNAPQERELKW